MQEVWQSVATCFEQVAFFFAGGDPKLDASFGRRAERLEGRSFAREELVRTLTEYHERLGFGEETMKNISALLREDTLTVVTGQQAGMLSGSLYTLYKAVTAIHLAGEQQRKLGRTVVPVFWIASEDHDWAEVRETVLLTGDGRPLPLRLAGEGEGLPVGSLSVPPWSEVADMLNRGLPESEFKSEMIQDLKRLTEQARNFSEWFALVLKWLTHDRGLIFFDPALPAFKRLASPVYERILKSHRELNLALEQRTHKLVSLAYKAQIELDQGEVNLFMANPERRALLSSSQGFKLRGKETTLTLDDLTSMLREDPGLFSPNVATRPLVQEYLLPTLAYVAGPGELNYWAQLGQGFAVFGFEMPVVYPRLSAVVLTQGWQRALRTEGLTVAQVYQGLAEYKERCVREQDEYDIDGHFGALRAQINSAYQRLDSFSAINSHAEEWVAQNQERVLGQISYLEKKIWQAQRKRCESMLRRIEQLEQALAPFGIRQERVFNPLSFVARFGPEFGMRVAELPLTADFREQCIII